MGLADDIINDFQYNEEEEEEEIIAPKKTQKKGKKPKPVVIEESDDEDNEDVEDDEEEKEVVEQKLDIKQIVLVLVSAVASYIIILQYKFADVFLEKYAKNIPLTAKRFGLFISSIIISYICSISLL